MRYWCERTGVLIAQPLSALMNLYASLARWCLRKKRRLKACPQGIVAPLHALADTTGYSCMGCSVFEPQRREETAVPPLLHSHSELGAGLHHLKRRTGVTFFLLGERVKQMWSWNSPGSRSQRSFWAVRLQAGPFTQSFFSGTRELGCN